MKKPIASLLAVAFAAASLLPGVVRAETASGEAKPKPRSVILSSYFEDGIVTKKEPKKKKAAPKKKSSKKSKAEKSSVKKAPAKKSGHAKKK